MPDGGTVRMRLRHLLVLFFTLLFLSPALAAPSLWHVTGPRNGKGGDAYLFGSVHVLPPDVEWRGPEVAAAMKKAQVFVFEVPQSAEDMARLQALIQARGTLPAGESLRALLPDDSRADYDAALAAAGLAPAQVDGMRPWLAALQMLFHQLARHNFSAGDGVDNKVMAQVAGRERRYLETIEEQFALLAPDDPALEMEEFRASLKDLRDASAQIRPLVDAWQAGDQSALDDLINGGLADHPAARKALLDDRNARWLVQLRALLREKKTFFITVGAGHLTGPKGLPALLRKAGFRVTGP
ncbi:MAG: hypothetical protein BGN82_10195 [Alphaproteobacteria bacterium 65-7]|nr:MAG: hypothetical protein BGN82_10195 [Alphaproteobacteria bacterium 65-7]